MRCAAGGDRTQRHNAIRDVVARWASDAHWQPVVEKPDVLPDVGSGLRRPADRYGPGWAGERPAALDVAVTCRLGLDMVHAAARTGGAVLFWLMHSSTACSSDRWLVPGPSATTGSNN